MNKSRRLLNDIDEATWEWPRLPASHYNDEVTPSYNHTTTNRLPIISNKFYIYTYDDLHKIKVTSEYSSVKACKDEVDSHPPGKYYALQGLALLRIGIKEWSYKPY